MKILVRNLTIFVIHLRQTKDLLLICLTVLLYMQLTYLSAFNYKWHYNQIKLLIRLPISDVCF